MNETREQDDDRDRDGGDNGRQQLTGHREDNEKKETGCGGLDHSPGSTDCTEQARCRWLLPADHRRQARLAKSVTERIRHATDPG